MSDTTPGLLGVPRTAGAGIVGIGTDLLSVDRIEAARERHGDRFARRILTLAEYDLWKERNCSTNFLAKQFAAKEALSKALGTGIAAGVGFQQLQILRDDRGCPCVTLLEAAGNHLALLGGRSALVSLSDDKGFILAFAVLSQ